MIYVAILAKLARISQVASNFWALFEANFLSLYFDVILFSNSLTDAKRFLMFKEDKT